MKFKCVFSVFVLDIQACPDLLPLPPAQVKPLPGQKLNKQSQLLPLADPVTTLPVCLVGFFARKTFCSFINRSGLSYVELLPR